MWNPMLVPPGAASPWLLEALTLKDLSAENVLPEGLGQKVPEALGTSAARQEENQEMMWLSRKEEKGDCPNRVK